MEGQRRNKAYDIVYEYAIAYDITYENATVSPELCTNLKQTEKKISQGMKNILPFSLRAVVCWPGQGGKGGEIL